MIDVFVDFIYKRNLTRRLDTPWVRVRLADGKVLTGQYCHWMCMSANDEDENYWVSLSDINSPAVELRFQSKDCVEVEEIDVDKTHFFEDIDFKLSNNALKRLEALWQQSKHENFEEFFSAFLEETLSSEQNKESTRS